MVLHNTVNKEKAGSNEVSKLANELTNLRTRISGEITGGRWLWTSGKLLQDGRVPWEAQVNI
jgi:hypothetical protein